MRATRTARCSTNTSGCSSLQAKLAAGEAMPDDDAQRMQQIGALLQFNPDVSAYLLAEFRFQRMLSDIFKILADVAGVDLDALVQG